MPQFDYAHQIAAAQGMVCHDRLRQLSEQADSKDRKFYIEFPANALSAASPSLHCNRVANPSADKISISLGPVLPGYAMSVLDWYARALQSSTWHDFLPEDPSIYDDDKWYWVYCYAAMRLLGMDEFAGPLHIFIQRFLRDLATNFTDYAHLIRSLPPNDPLLWELVTQTASQMHQHTLPLSSEDCASILEHFPEFAAQVNSMMSFPSDQH